MRHLYVTRRIYALGLMVAVLFAASHWVNELFGVAVWMAAIAGALVGLDALLLFGVRRPLLAQRHLPRMLTLGDNLTVRLQVYNALHRAVDVDIIDELPFQIQRRDFRLSMKLLPKEKKMASYKIRPITRAEYNFGDVHLYFSNPFRWQLPLGFLQRRITIPASDDVAVYPSVLQMRRLEMQVLHLLHGHHGVRRIRRIGHSYEFEQIKEYVRGDDYRSINWKATGRRHKLMVNQYEDERSQQVYCLIDKSRVMRMAFQGMSLLDHAINSALALSNIALKKHDMVGLITFSDKLGSVVKAERRPRHLHRILQQLYNEKERYLEANYDLLYYAVRKFVSHRSMLVLFTNFESMHGLERALPQLRRLAHQHLLVVVFFINTEVEGAAFRPATSVEDMYTQAIAQKFVAEKSAMAATLRQYGVQTILTHPDELSLKTIEKYLEIKARGLL